jgi:hypothetical protein
MGFQCEVALRGDSDDEAGPDLMRVLREEGASRVVPLAVGELELELELRQRSAGLVDGVMMAVTFGGTVIAIVDVVRRWLAERPRHANQNNGSRSVKITIDGETIEITEPSTLAEQRLVDLFIERHS